MSRDPRLYLADILEAIRRVRILNEGVAFEQFQEDWRTLDATLRNLEILGEAVKHLPSELTSLHPQVAWKNIAGFRDFLAHAYFGVDEEIVWDILTTKLVPLEEAVRTLLAGLG
ncbi:DUF86 domain-containing protein [Geothrix sp. PMB-07]|uniref:HepT-like ribonuclease domain-containing protein n=1 Tax=Geothrix sp. PMB-07 TaxID=3068640 RepID=UPI00274190B8|nr:DUF86 domain-containing protein [Geothrix sp. PMB-07]WLT31269.1 DUF86 domain-containing protein [Geothrix sp. PMB-07]